MKTINYAIFSAIIIAIFSTSCATVFSGTKSGVKVTGSPDGAKVYYNGNYEGEAPVTVKVSKNNLKGNQTKISVEKNGYEKEEVVLQRKVKIPAIIGNVLFTGAIGLIVDFATGAIYRPYPGKVKYELIPSGDVEHDFKTGEEVIFTYDKYENQEGVIKALYSNRALIKATVKNNAVQQRIKGEEYSEIEIEVPFVNIAKK